MPSHIDTELAIIVFIILALFDIIRAYRDKLIIKEFARQHIPSTFWKDSFEKQQKRHSKHIQKYREINRDLHVQIRKLQVERVIEIEEILTENTTKYTKLIDEQKAMSDKYTKELLELIEENAELNQQLSVKQINEINLSDAKHNIECQKEIIEGLGDIIESLNNQMIELQKENNKLKGHIPPEPN